VASAVTDPCVPLAWSLAIACPRNTCPGIIRSHTPKSAAIKRKTDKEKQVSSLALPIVTALLIATGVAGSIWILTRHWRRFHSRNHRLASASGVSADAEDKTHAKLTGPASSVREHGRTIRLGKILTAAMVLLLLWFLLAYHTIAISESGMLVILKKTSWTFDGCIIIEGNWQLLALHHPVLASRLLVGQGTWLLGSSP